MAMCTTVTRSVEDVVQRRLWFPPDDLARVEPSDDSRQSIEAAFAGAK
jgi:hypothetical protein